MNYAKATQHLIYARASGDPARIAQAERALEAALRLERRYDNAVTVIERFVGVVSILVLAAVLALVALGCWKLGELLLAEGASVETVLCEILHRPSHNHYEEAGYKWSICARCNQYVTRS